MKYSRCFVYLFTLLFPVFSISQYQMNVRAIDIIQKTDIPEFKLMVIHDDDTTEMTITTENTSIAISPEENQIIFQQKGYRSISAEKWRFTADTSITEMSLEFRLMKENATRQEVRTGKKNSRKMGIDDSKSLVKSGGFQKIRPGIGRYFTSIVYIIYKDSFACYSIAE